MKKIAILGVGLIGASLGKALLSRGAVDSISGFGRRRSNLETALETLCITQIAGTVEAAVRDAEIVVVCTPVETIAQTIRTALPHVQPGTIFTDVGSTKASIFDDFHELCENFGCVFIGGHPIAGKETSGAAAADENLFVGKTTVLTNREPADAYEKIAQMWRNTGANVVFMPPLEHDAVLARTSHLPHLISCLLSAATDPSLYPFSGTGYLSMTRLAAGSPDIWRDILTDNRQNVLAALETFTERLDQVREFLTNGETDALETFLKDAKANRSILTQP